ncbi:MAG TPA: glycosyltransferase family 2 protein [Desulfatiglandales bacterium]|nr:glycosyltransferase family 2 protein [Desulfatiglandales bacterium]
MLSIVIPTFNSENYIPELYVCIKKALENLSRAYELIFVDDGSVDRTVEILKELRRKEEKIRVVRLRRNLGQHMALFVGICQARGDVMMMMDADLRYDPADIPRFLEKIDEGYDFISGWRVDRNDPFLARIVPSCIINAIFFYLFGIRLHDYACSFKCFQRNIAEEIINDGTIDRVAAKLGRFSYTEVRLNQSPRQSGPSTYTLFRLIKVAREILSGFILGKLNVRNRQVDLSRLVEEVLD